MPPLLLLDSRLPNYYREIIPEATKWKKNLDALPYLFNTADFMVLLLLCTICRLPLVKFVTRIYYVTLYRIIITAEYGRTNTYSRTNKNIKNAIRDARDCCAVIALVYSFCTIFSTVVESQK